MLVGWEVLGAHLPPVQTVFLVVLENHDWSSFIGQTNAPYVNKSLLPIAAYCGQYYNPPGMHPSLPDYLWLEAGTNFGILQDLSPLQVHLSTTNHLVALLDRAGISWRTYQEDISGGYVPLSDTNYYVVRHDPFLYFDDVTATNDPNNAYAITHVRPYSELADDLTNGAVARYNFISPNLCNAGHSGCEPLYDPVRQTDTWLATQIPMLLASAAYTNNGAIFITWDEGVVGDGPIGMILLSPLARGGGYRSDIYHTHSSLLRTLQEFFGVTPLLGDAVNADDLAELFSPPALSAIRLLADGSVQITAANIVPGATNLVQGSSDLITWEAIITNSGPAQTFDVVDSQAGQLDRRFYRLLQLP